MRLMVGFNTIWTIWIAHFVIACLFAVTVSPMAAQEAAQEAAETTLRVGLTGAPPSKGNPYQNLGTTSNLVWPAFYDTLTYRDNEGAIVPGLATSWERDGPKTWIFHLRPGVQFSNGEPLTADSVKVTFDMLRSDEARGFSWQREIASYPAVDVIDDLTVAIHTDAPDLLTPGLLTGLYIAPAKYLTEMGYQGLQDAPVGSGPFAVERWEPAKITLTANRTSWHPPKVDRMEMLVVPDSSARLQALIAGRIDVAISVSTDQMEMIEQTGHRTHLRTPTRILVLSFKSTVPGLPFYDERVRQAVNYAVNMEMITEVLLAGLVKPASQPATPGSVGYDPDLKPYSYDPDKARALLKEAGYENGFSFTNIAPGGTLPNDTAILQQIASDLSAVGITMKNRIVTYPQLLRAVIQGDFEGESLLMDFNGRYGDAIRPMERGFNHSCSGPGPWFCNQAIQVVMEKATVTADMAERIRLSQQVVRFYRNTAESLFMFPVAGLDGIAKRVRHWEPWNDVLMFQLVELDESR